MEYTDLLGDRVERRRKQWRDSKKRNGQVRNKTWHAALMWMGHLRRRYGMSLAGYLAAFQQQGGRCAICRRTAPGHRRLGVDHCHKTGKVRGLLCDQCNLVVGPGNLVISTSAVSYLKGAL